MKDVVIRYESNNIIIWSDKYKAYYTVKDPDCNKEVRDVLEGKISEGKIYKELKDIGAVDGTRREIKSTNKNGLMAPLEYYFDFTNVCNLRCIHCYNRENMNTQTMSTEKIEKIITDMYESGVMRLHLAGGEPTLFPKELDVYMGTAKKYGILTSMASNGVVITDKICEILDRNDVMSITISVESANEEENAKIRGAGNLQKAIDGIKKLSEYRKKHGSKYFIGVKVSYDANIAENEFEDLIKLCKELNIDIIKFANPERCIFHEKGYYSKVADKYYKNMEIVRNLKKKYDGGHMLITQIASPVNNCMDVGLPNMRGCIGAQELIAINCKGEVNPCLMNPYELGNIFDYDSVRDLYKSDVMQEYYKKITNYDCGDCKYHKKCRGGCQVRKIVEYGEIEKTDPLCPIKQNQKIDYKEKESDSKLMKVCVLHSL